MILDENSDQLLSASVRLAPDTEKEFTLRIECRAGYFLAATCESNFIDIFAKAETGDLYQSIIAAPLSLSPFAGQIKTFYLKIEADGGVLENDYLSEIKVVY